MKKFGKRNIAATLAFASLLSHNPKSLALTKGQKTAVAVAGVLGGSAIVATACYLIFGKSKKPIVENVTKEGIQEELRKLKIKVDSEYLQKNYSGNFDLSEKGKMFISNPIFDTNTENVNADTLCQYLKELCEKTGIVKGIDLGTRPSDGEENGGGEYDNMDDGWQQSAWQYFFVENRNYANSNMYQDDGVSEYHRQLLAKCILIMYQHINDPKWQGIISSVIFNLSSHGGHCDWRTVSLIYSSYRFLLKFLHEEEISDPNVNPIDREFAFFKEAMVGDLVPMFLEYLRKKRIARNGQEGNNPEYLQSVNNAILGFEFLIGIPVDGLCNRAKRRGGQAFDLMFKYENLAEVSHNMADSLNKNKFFGLLNETSISFEEFCEYTMKTKKQIKEMLDKIWGDDDDVNKELREWVRGKLKLGAQQIVEKLVNIFYVDGLDKPWGVAWILCCIKNGYLVPKEA